MDTSHRESSWPLILAVRVLHCRPTPSLPTQPDPLVQFVQIGGPGEHQEPGRDQLVPQPLLAGEPPARRNPGAFGADVIAALRDLTKMIATGCSSGRFAPSKASPWSPEDRIWSLADMLQYRTSVRARGCVKD
jgi:hypothetical protein